MKVVDVNPFYGRAAGGVRSYVDRRLAAAPDLGIDLTVVVPGPVDEVSERNDCARVLSIASPSFPLDRRYGYFDDPSAVHQVLDGIGPDLVEASSPWRGATIVADWQGTAARALVMHADPLAAYAYRWFESVATIESIDRGFDWYWRRLCRFDRQFDLIVSPSHGLTARLRAGGLRRVETIPLGLTDRLFTPRLRDPELRRSLLAGCALDPDAMLLLGVGRLSAEKRWSIVIDAAMIAGCRRSVGLLIVGEGRDQGHLERQIGANPHIRMLPAIRDRFELARLMASCDALVHGCDAETFGLVAAEAKASGLALITPDRGGACDQVEPPRDVTFAAGSSAALAEAILGHPGYEPTFDKPIRMLNDHFRDLGARYAETIAHHRAANGLRKVA